LGQANTVDNGILIKCHSEPCQVSKPDRVKDNRFSEQGNCVWNFVIEIVPLEKRNVMETIRIEILNPKANQLLQDLADLNLIKIQPKLTIREALEKTRRNAEYVPKLDEITAEVEEVRQARYGKKK